MTSDPLTSVSRPTEHPMRRAIAPSVSPALTSYSRTVDTCKTVMAGDSSAAYTDELAPAFWQVLRKLDKKPLLKQLLAKAVKLGDRPSSAAAQVLRGDLITEAANHS